MAADTVTDMKGNVVKMEVDYSDAVDKMLPECEKLVKVTVNTHISTRIIITKRKESGALVDSWKDWPLSVSDKDF